MTRKISAANLTALRAENVTGNILVKLAFPSGTRRYWSGIGDLSEDVGAGFETWQGVGAFGEIEVGAEGTDLRARTFRIALALPDSTLVAAVQSENIHGRDAGIWMRLEGSSGARIDFPFMIVAGYMDKPDFRVGAENVLLVDCFTDDAGLQKAGGLLFTDEDQQRLYPGDKAFQYTSYMIDLSLPWGGGYDVGPLGGYRQPATGPNPWGPFPWPPGP